MKMKVKIQGGRARSRRVMLRGVLRWLLYAAVLLLFYIWECNPLIKGFCPLLLIPLATAVSMHEGDLASGVFGVFCGLMLDMASGTLLGFSALWLLVFCPAISLLSSFLVKENFVSHFVLTAAAIVIMGGLDFLFLHWVWEGEQSSISFVESVLPAYLGAVVFTIPIYFLVRYISSKTRPREQHYLEESVTVTDAPRDKTRI